MGLNAGERRGFFIEFDTQYKQYLNLSASAWLVIKEDQRNFSNGEKDNMAGFLNRVFFNYYQEAEATISQRLINKGEELCADFSSKEFRSMEKKITQIYVDKLLEVYKKKLLEKVKSYEKGKGERFNINKENIKILQGSAENNYYDGAIGVYMKAVFEEYARKPMYEREQIYFKDKVEDLRNAISRKKKVKLSLLKQIDPVTHKSNTRKFYFNPYKIVQDKSRMFNYVLGYSEEEAADGTLLPKKAVCYRISRIDHLMVMAKDAFISQENKEAIDKMVTQKEPQFLTGELVEVKVRFTDKGIESFNRHLYMRPTDFKKVEDEKNVYVFYCTERQAANYFFKFAGEAQILAPDSLRESFIRLYKEAYTQYMKVETDMKKSE